jgi:thiol-disulfide isomerase/thioredoxin
MKTTWILLIAATCAQSISSAREATGAQRGDSPPPLGLESILQGPAGAQPNWTALKGKVVVLEFWATWCGPCIAAMPHLNELADKFKDQPVQFIAITDQEEKVVVPFLRKKPIHAWVGLDTDKSMFRAYGVTGIPHTLVVDQNGRIAAITNPTSLTEEHLTDLLAGKTIAFAQGRGERPSTPGLAPAVSRTEREALFQVIIRPSEGGSIRSTRNRGNLALLGATVLDVLSYGFSINPARIVKSSALPEGRFDFIVKTPETESENVKAWLQQSVEATFGIVARPETREMDAFVLKAGQLTDRLAPTVSSQSSSISAGGGPQLRESILEFPCALPGGYPGKTGY